MSISEETKFMTGEEIIDNLITANQIIRPELTREYEELRNLFKEAVKQEKMRQMEEMIETGQYCPGLS